MNLSLCCTNSFTTSFTIFTIYSTSISGSNYDIKTWPLADSSGYFVIGFDSSNIAKICKYTFSLSSAQCQTITNIITGYGHLMISNSQFFVLGVAPASPNNLQMYKITFSSTSVNWANQIACPSGTWYAYYSESVLSSDGSTIYSFFTFGVTKYLYFCGLSASDGSVATTRYKSSANIGNVYGSALSGDYVVATTYSPSSFSCDVQYLVFCIYNQVLLFWLSLQVRSGAIFRQVGPISNIHRFVVGGQKGNNGYTAKFFPQSISLNSDFSSATWSMTALSAGTDDIFSLSGVTIAAADASFTPPSDAYTNQTVTYNLVSSITSDAYLQTDTQTFSVSESTTSTQTPNLPCSFSGSTSITYSLSSYNGALVPSFVSIDSSTGVLSIVAPSVSSSTTYSFYIDSTISGISGTVQKIISLTVKKCTVSNCQICTATDSSVCATCSSGYSLSSGSWNLSNTQSTQQETSNSETAKSLSTSNQVVVGATAFVSVGY